MVFLNMEVLECLWVMEEVDIGLKIPDTLPPEIAEFIFVNIKVVMMEGVDIGLKIPDTLLLEVLEQVLMVILEGNISIRPATIPTITQVMMI